MQRTIWNHRARWTKVCTLVVLGSVPATVAGQTVVPFAVPEGTNTSGLVLPSSFAIPLPIGETVNPLGLTPGFYSINLGACMGAARGDCRGSFVT